MIIIKAKTYPKCIPKFSITTIKKSAKKVNLQMLCQQSVNQEKWSKIIPFKLRPKMFLMMKKWNEKIPRIFHFQWIKISKRVKNEQMDLQFLQYLSKMHIIQWKPMINQKFLILNHIEHCPSRFKDEMKWLLNLSTN